MIAHDNKLTHVKTRSFPVLLEVAEESSLTHGENPLDEDDLADGHPSDIYLGRYTMGATIDEDYITVLKPIAHTRADESSPRWTPDDGVAFLSDPKGKRGLYLWKSGRRAQMLVQGDIYGAAFSPDGKTLVYVAQGDKDAMWHVNVDGTGAHQLDTHGLEPTDVQYTPDGTSVVFGTIGHSDNDKGLYSLDLASGNMHRLTTEWGYDLAFSPDGKTLVYVKSSDLNKHELWSLDMASGRKKRLAEQPVDADEDVYVDTLDNPLFSPDGSRIIVSGGSTDGLDDIGTCYTPSIWVLPSKGGELHQIGIENADDNLILSVVPQPTQMTR